MAMGDGEVALTALEGSLRLMFRLTVCRPGCGDAPSVAFCYPFGETPDAWVPFGLSDLDGSRNGQGSDLDVASRRAAVNALDFLEHDLGMDRAVACAYLSAAADCELSQGGRPHRRRARRHRRGAPAVAGGRPEPVAAAVRVAAPRPRRTLC